ncbi:ABC-2 transporter permease [Marinicrinis lubricantis]|uniref:ABC-2 transporter permease n=1 Tax=Marinicrinis lubricantis TaxID=2086470 RepID=A0ABW1ITH5_9BACL
MLNLLRKDVFLQKKTLLILPAALLVYLFLDVSMIWVGLVFCLVIIMNAYIQDEKSSTHMLLNSLPYSRREIVSSKYIAALLFTFIVVATIFLGKFAIHREIMDWKQLLLIVSIVMISISLIFPFSYQFQSRYLYTASIVAFGIYLFVINFVIPNLNDRIRGLTKTLLDLPHFDFYLITCVSAIVLYSGSWILSIRIYKNKVF